MGESFDETELFLPFKMDFSLEGRRTSLYGGEYANHLELNETQFVPYF